MKNCNFEKEDGVEFIICNKIGSSTVECTISELRCAQLQDFDINSGGQKTLLAVAFIFAVASYNKSLFYILDEVDAALDEQNQAIVAKAMKEFFKDCQVNLHMNTINKSR